MEVLSIRLLILVFSVFLLFNLLTIVKYAVRRLDREGTKTYLVGCLALSVIGAVIVVNIAASTVLLALSYIDVCRDALIANPENPILPLSGCKEENFRTLDSSDSEATCGPYSAMVCSVSQYLEMALMAVGIMLSINLTIKKSREPKGPITKKFLLD